MSRFLLLPSLFVVLAALVVVLAMHLRLRRQCGTLNNALSSSRHNSHTHRNALEELKLKEALRDEFISTVSHEIRTPLTSIRGSLGLLSSGMLGPLDDRAANLLRIASSNTDRLVRLINDILDLQRMESGASTMPLLPCAVGEFVLHSVETMAPMAEAAGVTIRPVLDRSTERLVVEGDPDRLQQVLCNLLSNAIKFSPPHSTIFLRAAAAGGDLELRVEDAGRGVPEDQLESIFERFRQVDASDSRQKGGTGLGLAICRSIISQHNGTIIARRNDTLEAGRPGLTLVIHLPLSTKKIGAPAPEHTLLA